MSSPFDGPDPIQRKPYQNVSILKSREDVTDRQVDILLGMIDRVSHNLVILQQRDETTQTTPVIDGGVKISLELVAVQASSRLEEILKDDSRWNCGDFDKAFNQILGVQKANQDFYIQQTKSSAAIVLPSFIYKPSIIKASGKFYAYIGDPAQPDLSIWGEGSTPAEALIDFDASFLKAPADHISFVLLPRPDTTETDSTSTPTE